MGFLPLVRNRTGVSLLPGLNHFRLTYDSTLNWMMHPYPIYTAGLFPLEFPDLRKSKKVVDNTLRNSAITANFCL